MVTTLESMSPEKKQAKRTKSERKVAAQPPKKWGVQQGACAQAGVRCRVPSEIA